MQIRAVRNNNPGNLNRGANWQHLMPPEQMTDEQRHEPRFAVFETPAFGFRAMTVILTTYWRLHHINTIDGISDRWAPPSENNTEGHKTRMSSLTGFGRHDTLDMLDPDTLLKLDKGLSTIEVGYWAFQENDLQVGVAMALKPTGA